MKFNPVRINAEQLFPPSCLNQFLMQCLLIDEEIVSELNPWREKYDSISQETIATTDITLDHKNCSYAECIMGDVIADAYLSSYRNLTNDSGTAIALVQSGGIRITLPKGCEYLREDYLFLMMFESIASYKIKNWFGL